MPEARSEPEERSFIDEMPLFGEYAARWKDWPLEERIYGAYGCCTTNARRMRADLASLKSSKKRDYLAFAATALDMSAATLAKVMGKKAEEMEALAAEIWKRRCAPEVNN